MAKFSFITLYDKGCLGVRYLSACLKKEGHRTDIIYLGRHQGRVKSKKDISLNQDNLWVGVNEYGADLIRSYSDPISHEDTDILITLLKRQKPDIIGFSLRTMFLDTALQLTKNIRSELRVPIVYGGIAVTSEPEKCAGYADLVCLGEGEYSMLMLAEAIDKGWPLGEAGNIWALKNGKIHKNNILPLEQHLDNLPFPDYEPENKFSILDSRLIEHDPSIGNMSRFTYEMITSRGCPFACTYCCNDLLKRLYAAENFLRRRSVKNVIAELKEAKLKYNIKSVMFKDEVFTFGLEWIKEFSDTYKKEINLPFFCYTHPAFADAQILRLLRDCGMFNLTMGIQSGSSKVLFDVFNRRTAVEKIIHAAGILESLNLPLRPRFDIITNNPFEAEDDCRGTLDLLMRLPKPVNFSLTKLSFIPGTRLIKMLEGDPSRRYVDERTYRFWNLLYLLNQYRFFPNTLIRYLSRNAFLKRHSGLLYFLLLPKFIEIKFCYFMEGLKVRMPASIVLFLKRLRYRLKGY